MCGDFILNVGLPLTIGTRQKFKKVICFYSLVTIIHDI